MNGNQFCITLKSLEIEVLESCKIVDSECTEEGANGDNVWLY